MRKIVTLLVLSMLSMLAIAAGVSATVVDGTEVVVDVTYENLEDRADLVTGSLTFVVENAAALGTPDETVSLELINPAEAGLTATFAEGSGTPGSKLTFTLAAQATKTITMTIVTP